MYPNGTYTGVYYNPATVTNATTLAVGDYVYNFPTLTDYASPTPSGRYYFLYGDSSDPTNNHCPTGKYMNMTVGSDGKITSISCVS